MTPAIRQMNADERSPASASNEPATSRSTRDLPTDPPTEKTHLSLDQVNTVHMIGIGGIGMSALAHILLSRGIQVSGSDRSESAITRRLAAEGARIDTGHASAHVTDPDWVVYSAAIPATNPERITALERGIPQMDRAALLGCIIDGYRDSVSVAGSHGKTTTTALLAMLLEWGGLDPTILVGGELDAIGGNVKVGDSPVLVTEACEYQGSFLRFPARIGVVLNVDLDHLDYFKDLAAVQAVFRQFVRQLPPDGLLVMSATDANSALLQEAAPCAVVMIGVSDGIKNPEPERHGTSSVDTVTASELQPGPGGCWSFRLIWKDADLGRYQLGIPGRHNVHNALAALAVAMELGLDPEILQQLLPRFTGIHRRFEHHGVWKDVTIIDDYAHHPAEIQVTLAAARTVQEEASKKASASKPGGAGGAGRIICLFQPHTYTRTRALLQDFARALALADLVVVTDIYAAREPDEGLVHSRDLVALVNDRGIPAVYAPDYALAAKAAARMAQAGDMVITMGAGPVNEAVPLLTAEIQAGLSHQAVEK